jgi:hypothetical protein
VRARVQLNRQLLWAEQRDLERQQEAVDHQELCRQQVRFEPPEGGRLYALSPSTLWANSVLSERSALPQSVPPRCSGWLQPPQ